eukprot:644824-Rhodomonas_salina.1
MLLPGRGRGRIGNRVGAQHGAAAGGCCARDWLAGGCLNLPLRLAVSVSVSVSAQFESEREEGLSSELRGCSRNEVKF